MYVCVMYYSFKDCLLKAWWHKKNPPNFNISKFDIFVVDESDT